MALVIAPEQPISTWLAEVDKWLSRSPDFFARKSVVIDVAGLSLTKRNLVALIADLKTRDIRILGVEGVDPSWADNGLPPLLNCSGTELNFHCTRYFANKRLGNKRANNDEQIMCR